MTYDSIPRISHISCPSLRLSSLIFPAQFMALTPIIHSSVVSCVSMVNSCKCLINEDMISLSRGGVLGPMESTTILVNSLPKGPDSTFEPIVVMEQCFEKTV
jgi:hypothetical protein